MLLMSFAALSQVSGGAKRGKIQPGWGRLLLRKMVKELCTVAAAFYDQVWQAGGKQDDGLVWNGMTMRKKLRVEAQRWRKGGGEKGRG